MQKIIAASLLAAGLISGAALAADAAPAAKQDKPVPAMILGGAVKSEAEVIAIDLKTRKVTLKGEDGGVQEIVVGKDARNLPQVKVGDRVVTEYSQILAIKLKKGAGLRTTEEREGGARAAMGDKPGAVMVKETHFVADIIAIDAKKGIVTIKGAKGRIFDLKVKDKKNLAGVVVGDQVEGIYEQVLSLLVLSPAGK